MVCGQQPKFEGLREGSLEFFLEHSDGWMNVPGRD